MVESTGKPSAYVDGGGVAGDPRAPGRETGGAVRDGGGEAGPNRPDPNRESTRPSVDGNFENPFEEQSPANRVSFPNQVDEIRARSKEARASEKFTVVDENGELIPDEVQDAKMMPSVFGEDIENSTLANSENDPSPAAQLTLDLSIQQEQDNVSSDSGESDEDVVASVDSSSEGGDENV